ncbi:AP-1 complex subunit gamma [Gracilaria domingensis]|nr:AP-1 complex subunit gamma [Gracilaria domingensis]
MKSAKSNWSKAKRTYMCRTLKEVVKAYRACTTRSEERALVKKESAHIRDLFREGDKAFRRRNVAKLLFFHMNGYPTDFGMTECIKLCASNKYNDKRIAYLGLIILVDESEQILMLITNSLQRDLQSDDVNIISLALNLLSDIASVEMVRDLLPQIETHLHSPDPYIQKKAALAAVRALRKLTPEETSGILEAIPAMFESKSQRLYISASTLVSTLCKQGASDMDMFHQRLVPVVLNVCNDYLLRERTQQPLKGMPSTLVSKVKNPGIHVKLISTLRHLIMVGLSEEQNRFVHDILSQIASSTESTSLSGCAVLYECVRAIIALNPDENLWNQSISVLINFLSHKEATVRYIGLQELISVADVYGSNALSQIPGLKDKVLSGLRESDPTVRKRAAELLYRTTNESNCEEMLTALLEYIEKSKFQEAIQDGCSKLVSLLDRFGTADTKKVDMFVQALVMADTNMPEDLVNTCLALISSKPHVQGHAVKQLFTEAFMKNADESREVKPKQTNLLEFGDGEEKVEQAQHSVRLNPRSRKLRLERVAIYVLGEYGETTSTIGLQMPQVLDAFREVLASNETVEDIWLDANGIERNAEMSILTEVALTSLMKFVCHQSLPEPNADGGIESMFQALPAPPKDSSATKESTLADDLLDGLNLDDGKESRSLVPVSAQTGITSSALVSLENLGMDGASIANGSIPDQVCYILSAHAMSTDIEVQQRACEYMTLLREELRPVLNTVMVRLPPLDFATIQRRAKQRRASARINSSVSGPQRDGVLLDLIEDVSGEGGNAFPALPSTDGGGMTTDVMSASQSQKEVSLFDVLGDSGISSTKTEGVGSDDLLSILAQPSADNDFGRSST